MHHIDTLLHLRVRVDQIGRDCELKISKILLMVDPELGVTVGHYCVYVHGNIASSRVWVHGRDIHHSWPNMLFKTKKRHP